MVRVSGRTGSRTKHGSNPEQSLPGKAEGRAVPRVLRLHCPDPCEAQGSARHFVRVSGSTVEVNNSSVASASLAGKGCAVSGCRR